MYFTHSLLTVFRSAKSFEACLEEQSKTCPYLKKKFLQHVQDQDVANQAFDKCGIEITSNAGIYHSDQIHPAGTALTSD